MLQTKLFSKTSKNLPEGEESRNAQLLIKGGFVFKNSAGIYSFLPLGWKVAQKVMQIIREEMNAIDGQEMFMPALVEKKYMEPTGRWNLDVGFFAKGLNDKESNFVLGWSHEEVLTAIASKYINSYKDLPFAAYQIQTKFRNEARAKSGLLRGREFMMKDLYSFHADEKDLESYYERAKMAYFKVFERCGLKSFYTLAGGGVFTDKFTHEFQVLSDVGEDTIFLCLKCGYAENQEISKLKEGDKCPKCSAPISEKKSIEVGNIFNQGTKYSENLGLYFTDEKGSKHPVVLGAYGIGVSRLMATIVEIHNDEKGIVWPEVVAPFKVHLIMIGDSKKVRKEADKVYKTLVRHFGESEVLYDERIASPGEKLNDADLLGIPWRAVVSEKTVAAEKVELKKRSEKVSKLVNEKQFFKLVK
jgi:prolyl-tRNA synthetase